MADSATPIVGRIPFRERWLDQRHEEIVDPDLPIVDAHHHMGNFGDQRYFIEELLADVRSGHNIVATVYMEFGSSMAVVDDPTLAPVGETTAANGIATVSETGAYGPIRLCAGIVGTVDMTLGADARRVLEAHLRAGEGRFRGVRESLAWDAWEGLTPPPSQGRRDVMDDPVFREALACLAPLGLLFEARIFYPQMGDLIRLVSDFSDTSFVLNHLGGPLGVGPYAGRHDEIFSQWRAAIRAVAPMENVTCKIGGIGTQYGGFEFDKGPVPPSSEMLCDAWRPYVETCIESFGASRCMMESNFPVDKGMCSYPVLWNALKKTDGRRGVRRREGRPFQPNGPAGLPSAGHRRGAERVMPVTV